MLINAQKSYRHLSKSILSSNVSYCFRYSRKHFEDLNIDNEAIERQEQKRKVEEEKQKIFGASSNDKNPNNYLKNLRVGNPAIQNFENFDKSKEVHKCQILRPEPRKEKVFVTAIRKYIISSIDKAVDAMAPVRKRYLYDAINQLQHSHKKVAKLMIPTFHNLVKHAFDQGKDPLRLFVHGCIIGKTQRYKSIRYHGKAKTGFEKRDFIQVKVILYEMDEDEFYQKVGTGKAPPAFASFIRHNLMERKVDHERLMKFTGITTSKGRQQHREIIKRKVSMKMIENQKNGIYVPKKTVQKEMVVEEGEKAKAKVHEILTMETPGVLKREQLFKKNMGIE